MALLDRKRVILLELESSYGTDPTPTGADALQVSDLLIVPQSSDLVSRELIRPFLGASRQLLANTKVECSFSVEWSGSGAAGTAPRVGKALRACGFSETIAANTSVTYAPVSGSFESATIYYNVDGVLHKTTGCRGSFVLETEVGDLPKLNFTFTGIYIPPTDVALPAITYGQQSTPLVVKNGNTSGFQLLSYSGAMQALSIDAGIETEYMELVGGTKEVHLVNRATSGTVTLEAVKMATKDYFAAALLDTSLGNLTLTHGTVAGNIVQFSSSNIDIGDVAYTETNGVVMAEIPFTAVPSTSGNDEFSLIYR
tara:strand:- start:3266 stop:4201 length:936 start_codon:yes stop_codon:yes gene_type:complete